MNTAFPIKFALSAVTLVLMLATLFEQSQSVCAESSTKKKLKGSVTIQKNKEEAGDIGLAAADKAKLLGHAYDGELGQGSLTSIVTTIFDIAKDGTISGKYTSTETSKIIEMKDGETIIKGHVTLGKDKTLIQSLPGHENEDAFTGTLEQVKYEGDHKVVFRWTDKFGTGLMNANFSPDMKMFTGQWFNAAGRLGGDWNGKRP